MNVFDRRTLSDLVGLDLVRHNLVRRASSGFRLIVEVSYIGLFSFARERLKSGTGVWTAAVRRMLGILR